MASFESNLVDNEVKDDRHCGTWCFRITGIDVQEIMVEQIGEILEDSDDIAEKKTSINLCLYLLTLYSNFKTQSVRSIPLFNIRVNSLYLYHSIFHEWKWFLPLTENLARCHL